MVYYNYVLEHILKQKQLAKRIIQKFNILHEFHIFSPHDDYNYLINHMAIPIFLLSQPYPKALNSQTMVRQTETTVSYQVLFLHFEDAMMQLMSDLMSMHQKLMMV